MKTYDAIDWAGKRVLIREDLNVPLNKEGQVADDTRIRAAVPSIQALLKANARVAVMSHLGRPDEGEFDPALSLAPLVAPLSALLGVPVVLASEWLEGIDYQEGQVVLCENVRFLPGEKANDADLSEAMAALCDVYVMDAFATAHRAQASTCGIMDYAPVSVAGPLLVRELDALNAIVKHPKKPLVAIVGGSKVSTKIALLEALIPKVDTLIVGGGIANTLLAAKGMNVGASLYERDWIEKAKALFDLAEKHHVHIPLPVDVVVADAFSETAHIREVDVNDVADHEMILDVGAKTAATYPELMQGAHTIMWNGPVGVFEMAPFSLGTQALARAIADSPAYSVAGGGDTLAAIAQFHVGNQISYISTGGGAFLELVQGAALPALVRLGDTPAG